MKAASRTVSRTADGDLRFEVEDALRWDVDVPSMSICVSVKDRVATLTGTVPSVRSRLAALESAWCVHGLHGVVDDLYVVASENFQPSEQSIRLTAERLLLDSGWLTPDVAVSVQDSVVTLAGSVEDGLQRIAMACAIRQIDGVTWVQNDLVVLPGERGAGAAAA